MSPYLSAFDAYHAGGPPVIPWTTALDWHLQAGVVVSTAHLFLMARRVIAAWPDADHVSPRCAPAAGDCWHVWAAAGPLGEILAEARRHAPLPWVSFQRRTGRVHRWRLERLHSVAACSISAGVRGAA